MIKTTKLNQKSQKPIDFDIFLKYACPNCGQDHWIKYLQATTKNFRVVCDCGTAFKTKRITEFRLKYAKRQEETQKTKNIEIPEKLLEQCVGVLKAYGFDTTEAKDLLKKSYLEKPVDEVSKLVKQTLESMRTTNE